MRRRRQLLLYAASVWTRGYLGSSGEGDTRPRAKINRWINISICVRIHPSWQPLLGVWLCSSSSEEIGFDLTWEGAVDARAAWGTFPRCSIWGILDVRTYPDKLGDCHCMANGVRTCRSGHLGTSW